MLFHAGVLWECGSDPVQADPFRASTIALLIRYHQTFAPELLTRQIIIVEINRLIPLTHESASSVGLNAISHRHLIVHGNIMLQISEVYC